MKWEQKSVFVFTFPYEQTELSIPVKADSQEEAADKLQKLLSSIQTDLAMEFPKPMPTVYAAGNHASPGAVPPEVLELRIETLMKELGMNKAGVKKALGLEVSPENYVTIIGKLEALKNGQ